ncbi:pyridoxamine 5'-phosphate oxidase family protein [Iamia sp. SCSIO 61187]|uniref:pyridoxamine 5'-phosphate oxidase family protein n=1 Tax=Iamia sp. SCSIO 61187 TaxID=2722752 RepID=UPI001C62E475|nr:pyridoxamine 5'-phosphate oxidase family protein [Iamia sp. SCSIO 61187]QYG93516.1 pyridoxamine 5'-phosphate oxidase family protein [Iamia sp. SCSIO 61187]
MGTTDDEGGLVHHMDRAECLALLEADDVGRLAINQGNVPAIFPVNYVLDGIDIVFRTAPGSKVAHGPGTIAAFEIDDLDREARTAWSVVAVGRLEVVTEDQPDLLVHLRQLPISPWAGGTKDILMRLVPGTITGRLIGAERGR